MIANDADVSVIASHATRFVLDALVNFENSDFPNSAYAIGLKKEWIFTAPFDTRPIDLRIEGEWGEDIMVSNKDDLKKLFDEIFLSAEK